MTKKPSSSKTKKKFTYAVGRRKSATAQVRLFKGKGETLVNGLPVGDYFKGEIAKSIFFKPFRATNTLNKYFATILVKGSGKSSQLWAAIHGLARAFNKENQELFHPALKKYKLLTRDPRRRERRKPGQMGRARKKKQSPKR
ncbi:30S ribosomal protein S9 [Patescibacteria group bacterium]